MPSIIVVSGPNKGDYYPLAKKKTWTVGRLASCDIQIIDDTVSRSHCTLTLAEDGQSLTVRDKESRHGTSVNGQPVTEEATAGDGDEIQVGTTDIVFTIRDHEDRESALRDQHLKRWFGEDARNTMM